MEYRIIRKDGSPCWVSERGNCIRDEKGSPLYLDGVIPDITAIKIRSLLAG